MNEALPSTIGTKNRLGAAIGGPIRFWSTLSKGGIDLTWVLAGKFTSMGANAALMLFLAERFDLQTYGILVITISCQLLISRVLLLGVDVGMMRLSAIPDLQSREREVVTAGLVIIFFNSVVLIAVSLLSVLVLAQFGIPGWVIACVVLGSIGTAFVDYGYGFRLANQQYPLAALAQGGTALLRLGITTIAALLLAAHPVAVFLAYHGASLCSGLIQTLIIVRSNWREHDKALRNRLLRYSLWQGKANVVVIFTLYQGTFVLMLLKEQAETGIFGLALTLSLGFFAIYNAYGDYLLARIRSVEHVSELRSFIRHTLLVGLFLILACVPVVFALAKLLPWFLGPEWLEVVPVFVYLTASMLLLILQAPLEAACHYVLKPHLVTFGWVVRAVLICAGSVIFASTAMRATGVAMGQTLGSALALMVLSYVVAGKLRSATKVDGQLLPSHHSTNS
jgi:O-antigen/teichoic acid export membrane protein